MQPYILLCNSQVIAENLKVKNQVQFVFVSHYMFLLFIHLPLKRCTEKNIILLTEKNN